MEEKLKQIKSSCKRVVLYGPESTGKTTLAKKLSDHYNEPWVPEFARDYLQKIWDHEKRVCEPKDLSSLKEKLESDNFIVEASEIVMETETNIPLDSDQSEKNMKLTDAIEDLDDVQEVFTNADLDESVFQS